MKKIFIIISLTINTSLLLAQINLTIEGTTVINTEPESWLGVKIERSVPTKFIYRNNSITSVNTFGYLLQAGDEGVNSQNNNLDGQIITGNKFTWEGTDMTSITHGVFTGYNKTAILTYNYLHKVPMGLLRKSNGMTDATGGVAYNIVISPNVGIVVKGINGVRIYNNTLYSERTSLQTWRPLVHIYENTDIVPAGSATGTKVYNNIFYTKYQIYNITIDTACLQGFECDYNIYYCESGTPVFNIGGDSKTFVQWQALGYDKHSVVVNPNFINTTDLVPAARLDFGMNLGTEWETGLSVTAIWIVGVSPATTNQNGIWQVGARVYEKDSLNSVCFNYVAPFKFVK